jgi:hypothetical protein
MRVGVRALWRCFARAPEAHEVAQAKRSRARFVRQEGFADVRFGAQERLRERIPGAPCGSCAAGASASHISPRASAKIAARRTCQNGSAVSNRTRLSRAAANSSRRSTSPHA